MRSDIRAKGIELILLRGVLIIESKPMGSYQERQVGIGPSFEGAGVGTAGFDHTQSETQVLGPGSGGHAAEALF